MNEAGETAGRKVESIQLLRAVAAAVVAIMHIGFAFADHVGTGLGVPRPSAELGQIAVAIFFVVSGYVMVVSSRSMFGRPDATLRFWLRRLIRIMPPYWLATGLLVGWFLWLGRSVDLAELGKSLLLIPYGDAQGPLKPLPLLWPGWTLFYELLFYALFGLGLSAGRRGTVVVTITLIAVLVAAGIILAPATPLLFSLTSPVLLLFPCGIALALFRERGGALPNALRAMFAGLGVVALAMLPSQRSDWLGFSYLIWAGLPALLFAIAVLGGPLRLPMRGLVDRLGDTSYALYLLHVPIANIGIWLYVRTVPNPGAWDFFVTCLAITYAASFLFFSHVERPMTRWLNRRLAGGQMHDERLQQTGI